MPKEQTGNVVKKTVAIHPIMDSYIRKTWAMLIEGGHDASYSTALNWMLLAAIGEVANRKKGLSRETIQWLADFAEDQETIKKLNIQDNLSNLKDFWGMDR